MDAELTIHEVLSMLGRFALFKELEFTTFDWGRIAGLCHPGHGAKQLTVLDGRLNPGKGHDFHKHANQEEVILVVSGRIEQWIDTEKKFLGPGDSVFIASNTVHASFNVGDDEANIIAIFGPCVGDGGFEMIDVGGEAPWKDIRQTN